MSRTWVQPCLLSFSYNHHHHHHPKFYGDFTSHHYIFNSWEQNLFRNMNQALDDQTKVEFSSSSMWILAEDSLVHTRRLGQRHHKLETGHSPAVGCRAAQPFLASHPKMPLTQGRAWGAPRAAEPEDTLSRVFKALTEEKGPVLWGAFPPITTCSDALLPTLSLKLMATGPRHTGVCLVSANDL